MSKTPQTIPPTKPKILREKWKRFVDELITTYDRKSGHFNNTEAYLRVYPRCQNRVNGARMGARLLQNVHVQAYFVQLRDQLLAKLALDVRRTLQEERAFENRKEDVLRELACIAYTRMTDLAQWGPDGVTIVDSGELNPMFAASVKKIKQRRTVFLDKEGTPVSERTDVEIEQHSKERALELLGNNVKAFGDNVNLFEKPYAVLIPNRRRPGEPLTIQKEKSA